MAVFEFKGIDKSGKDVKGLRNSDTESQLKALLSNEGIFVTNIKSIKQKTSAKKSTLFQKKITSEDLSIMTKQLAVLTRSGITLV